MKTRKMLGILALALVLPFALPLTSSAQDVHLLGAVVVPGSPILSSDITWVDPQTERAYFTDRSNKGVDIIDAQTNLFVGRVNGMVGVVGTSDGTTANNGPGPNGVLVTSDKVLWAGDGNSTTTVADVDPSSPTYLQILKRISTTRPSCDDGTHHWCGRDDEIGYDPQDRIIMIATNGPRDATTPGTHPPVAPYVTFISADAPYPILGTTIAFPGANGLEQPLWDPDLRGGRFLLTVVGSLANHIPPSVAIIDPVGLALEETIYFNCQRLAGTTSDGITGIALGRDEHILVSACGAGATPSSPIIFNPDTLEVYNVVGEVGGGDQVWYNDGDNRFYVTGVDRTVTTGGKQSLGVIDGATSTWLQNVTAVKAKNPSAFAENNHVFTLVQINAAIAADPTLDDSVCTQFGIRGTGCIAIFGTDTEEN